MSWHWTETLRPEIRSQLPPDLDCRQLVRSKGKGWLLCAPSESTADPLTWYRIGDESRDDPESTLIDPLLDSRLPGLEFRVREGLSRGAKVQLLAYRPGRRAVIRTDGRSGVRIHKIFHRDRAVWSRWQTCAAPPGSDWRTPALESWDDERRVLTMGYSSGVALHDLWRQGRADPAQGDILRQVLEGLRRNAVPIPFPHHSPADEQQVIDKQLSLYRDLAAAPAADLLALTEQVIADLDRVDSTAKVLTHRDFHDKQVLITTDRPVLIDFDLAASAPPGLDEGNMLAHIRLRALQNEALDRPLPWREIAERFLAASLDRESLPIWTAAALVRLALLYARRQHPRGLVEQLTEAARNARTQSGNWKDLV